jgi:hypothetical protein
MTEPTKFDNSDLFDIVHEHILILRTMSEVINSHQESLDAMRVQMDRFLHFCDSVNVDFFDRYEDSLS